LLPAGERLAYHGLPRCHLAAAALLGCVFVIEHKRNAADRSRGRALGGPQDHIPLPCGAGLGRGAANRTKELGLEKNGLADVI